jgi:hypothetical protein
MGMKTEEMKISEVSNPSTPIELEILNFKVQISASVIELREKEHTSQSSGEMLTVKYLLRSQRAFSLYLQTLLDLIMRKDKMLLNLGEYFVLEDLVSRILEQGFKGNEPDNKLAIEQMLSFALLVLRVLPLETKFSIILFNQDLIKRRKLYLVLEQLNQFSISDNRELSSRVSYYDPYESISFTVGLPQEEREGSSKPYDSYTRGYGESGSRVKRTPYDWEIDGEDIWNFSSSQSFQLIDLQSVYRES